MPDLDEAIVQYAVYEDATEYRGIAEVTLPNIEYFTATINGAGISGEYEEVLQGLIKAMTLSMNFNNFETKAVNLAVPDDHNIDLRAALQVRNNTTGKIEIKKVKHVMVVVPKSTTTGKVANASSGDASGEYSVKYWAYYLDGEQQLELDPLNGIIDIGGTDWYAPIKAAIGK